MGFSSASISSNSTSSVSSYPMQAQSNPSEQPTKNAENSSQDDPLARLFVDCSITAGLTLINPWAAGAYGVLRGINLVHKVVSNFFSERKAAAEALIKQKEALIKQQEALIKQREVEARAKQEQEARIKQEQEAKVKQEQEAKIKCEVANALKAKMAAEAAAEAEKAVREKKLLDSLIVLHEKKQKTKQGQETVKPTQAVTASSDVTAVDIPPQKPKTPELQNVTLLSQNTFSNPTTAPLKNNYKPVSTCKRTTCIALIAISAITIISSSFLFFKSRFFNE